MTGHDPILDRLRAILDTGKMPAKAAQSAQMLIRRMEAPVRLVLMGPPGGGKSTLCNILIGAEVVPQDMKLPTTDIRFADAPALAATLPDGSRRIFGPSDFEDMQACRPALVEIRSPVPALQRFSVLEVVTDGSQEELAAAARWAARRADMAMWVTPEFGPLEQQVWQDMPEALKNHAFLVKSLLDRHSLERQELIRQLPSTAAGDAFLGLFPVSALQVAVAKEAGVEDLTPVMEVSGCTALCEAMDRRLDIGRQADLDAAEYLLARFGDLAPPRARAEPAVSVPETAAPAMAPRPSSRRLLDMDNAPAQPAATEPAPTDDPSPPRRTSGLLRAADLPESDPPLIMDRAAGLAVLDGALAALREGAADMLSVLDQDQPGEILDRCTTAMDTLADLAQGTAPLEGIVAQAADVVLLLNLEQSESAAEDAVCALLQLKREFEVCLAA